MQRAPCVLSFSSEMGSYISFQSSTRSSAGFRLGPSRAYFMKPLGSPILVAFSPQLSALSFPTKEQRVDPLRYPLYPLTPSSLPLTCLLLPSSSVLPRRACSPPASPSQTSAASTPSCRERA